MLFAGSLAIRPFDARFSPCMGSEVGERVAEWQVARAKVRPAVSVVSMTPQLVVSTSSDDLVRVSQDAHQAYGTVARPVRNAVVVGTVAFDCLGGVGGGGE